MATKQNYAPNWPAAKRIPHRHIDFGSSQHAALLGIADEESIADMDPAAVARLQRQLEREPVVTAPETKKPINTRTYGLDEPIIDGWARHGRR